MLIARRLHTCIPDIIIPRQGSFSLPGSLGIAAGDVNPRRYVENDPVNTIDPTGLFPPEGLFYDMPLLTDAQIQQQHFNELRQLLEV